MIRDDRDANIVFWICFLGLMSSDEITELGRTDDVMAERSCSESLFQAKNTAPFPEPCTWLGVGVCIASGQSGKRSIQLSFQQCSGREQGPREGTKSVSLAKTNNFYQKMVFTLDTHKHSLLKDFVNM